VTDRSKLSRRRLLGTAAATGMALPGGAALGQGAAPTPVDVLLVNATVAGPLRTILEQEANVKITDGPWQSSTDVVSRVSAPGGTSRWDLVNSSFDFSKPVIMGARAGDEKVRPIDLSLIPNLQHLTAESRAGIGERDGRTYMLPMCWGFDTVLYDTRHVPPDDLFTNSWAVLFEDRYAGRIGWWDVAHQMLMAAGLYLGHAEPEKMDRGQLNEVVRFLISRKKNVRTFYTTFAQGSNLLASGEIVACYGIVPMRVELQSRGFPIAGAWAKEGVLSLILSLYIPKEAKQPAAAARMINTILDARYASQLTRSTGYLSASSLAQTGLSAEERKNYGYGLFDGSVKHYLLKFPANMNMWIEAWSRVKSA
jgi:spermidine/putrescine transport system substrate-binding protein